MTASSLRRLVPLAGALFLGSLAAACGSSNDTQPSGGGGSTTTGNGGSGAQGGSGGAGAGFPTGCEPACVEPQVCSVAFECIDPGTCLGDGDCPPGTICDEPTKTCVPGGGCGGKEVKADPVAPNLLIVLDRSCSMTAGLGGGVNKWQAAVAAINTMTTQFAGKIRFGLTLFPDLVTPNCQQAEIPIPVGPDNETAIQTLLTNALAGNDPYFPDGPCVTNIDTAMLQATTEPAFGDTDRESYALLITDGKQSSGCSASGGDNGTEMIIQQLHEMQGVPTFVLGFGKEIDPAQMNEFAELGGVPAGPDTKYYDAQDQVSLDTALKTIADKTLGCTFTLEESPPNPNEIFVFFDNVDKVPRDSMKANGWDYDASEQQVTFYGEYCDKLKSGEVTDVDIIFGCDEPTPD